MTTIPAPPEGDGPTGFDLLLAELQRQDVLGVVLRSTILIENELILFVSEAVVNPKAISKTEFELRERIDLAIALGLPDFLQSGLRAIASVRNKFAHRLEARLGENEIDNLYNSFSPKLKAIYQTTITNLENRVDRQDFPKLDEADPLDKFRVMALTIFFGIAHWRERQAAKRGSPASR